MKKEDIYFVTLPGDIDKDYDLCAINLLTRRFHRPHEKGGHPIWLDEPMFFINVGDKDRIKKDLLDDSNWYGYEVVKDKDLAKLQQYLLSNKDKIIHDFKELHESPRCDHRVFEIVSANALKAICQVDIEKGEITPLTENNIQIPPMVNVRIKTKHLKKLAEHLQHIIKGYAPEYAIPVDFGYMLYEITKEDQKNDDPRKENSI